MEQVNLEIDDNSLQGMEFAFEEARQRLTSLNQSFEPFTVTVVDEGFEVNDHTGDSPEAIRESVKMLLAQDMPESYALCYDGWVETDDGHLDAVIVELASRGAVEAFIVAQLYRVEDGTYSFDDGYCYAGSAAPLYPAGTKPIVSGLAALQADEASSDADAAE